MSFRIHQRKHTEEAKRRGTMEGEEPFRPVEDHESIDNDGDDDGHRACRSANQNASTPAADNAVNIWKRLKKITNKVSRAQIGKPQLREEVQKQLRANAVAAVKNIILATRDARKKRGKYHKYPQDVQDKMARYAIQHGILKTTRHFSDQLGVSVSNSTVRNIVKLHNNFTPQLKEEIGRFAAGFGVEAASRHFSERLDREVRQSLVRKFKKLYVARLSDCCIKLENSGHPSTVSSKQKNIFDEKIKEEIGKYACEAGIASTVKFFLEKHTLRLKESLVRRLKKQYLDRNKSHTNGSNIPEVCQHKQSAITEETQRLFQGNDNVVHAIYTDQVYQSAPYIQTNGNLLPPQDSALHFNTINNTTNSAGFLSYQQVPSSTTSVIVNQDSISLPIFQQPEQMYSSVTPGHIIHGSVIPVPTSLASVPHSHFHFQPPVVTNTADTVRDSETSLQPEHQFQQVASSSANTSEVTVATVHVVPSLPQKQQPQTECNSSPCSLQPQAVVINESQHPSTESSYPGTVVQTVGDKITMLSTVDTGGASLMTDRDGTYALTTCIPTGEKSLYKPQAFHLPISRLDTLAMAVCRDDSQTMNDVIITIVPSSENEKSSCKDDASFQDCQKISNNTFLLEKGQQHVYQKHFSKEQSHVIPVQLQQIEHFPEGQSHKQKIHQEQPEEQQQEKHHHLSGPKVLHLQLPLLQEQEDKTLFRYKQQEELPQKAAYQQQQSYHLQQPLLIQQNDCPMLQNDQHRQILLLQPQEQPQKHLSQQNQQHSQQMQQQLLHQPVELQEPQAESVQHHKKQNLYHPQQQLLLLQPHLNQNQLHKLVHQQNQLQLLQLQQSKESMQQQKSKVHEHEKLIQIQQLVNSEQKHIVNQQKPQQLLQSQQPLFQLHLQFDLEQQKSAHEQAQQHSHHSQLYVVQEQTQEQSQQHKLQHLHQLQQEVLQLQHQELQLQHQLDHEQLYKSAQQEQPQVLHLHQQLVPNQTQKPTHQEKLQHLYQSEHQVCQLQEQLVQDQEPVDEETQQHPQQTEHRILELQEQLVQEQVQKPNDKEKQQHSHQSPHQVQQLPQQLNNEQPHQPVDEEKQEHFKQSQHQVFLLQQHLIQKQPQTPTNQEKHHHLLWPQYRVDKLQQHLVQKESQKLVSRNKCQNQHQSEHQAINLQHHLDEEQPHDRESVEQEKQQHLHLPQHQVFQVQQHLVEEQPQVPTCQEKQQNVYQSEHQVFQSQHHLVQEQQQQQLHQDKQLLHQSHHEELTQKQLAPENVQEPAHQEKSQHLHHSHHKAQALYHHKHLSQEQAQESALQEKVQQMRPHLQQPHQTLHLEHASHHEQLKKQANQQIQLLHPNLFNPQQKYDGSKTHNSHQQSLQSQQHKSNNLGEEKSLQEQKSYQSSHQKRQLEVLPYVKVTCSFEDEESTDEPDKMVIYVADASDITRETTAKEQKKNSLGNSRKENNRNKSKAGDSNSHKRGNYTLYSPEIRAELGKYAAEYGNQRAREYFKDILGHEVPESTIRSLRDKYILKCHLNSNAPDGINSVTSLGYSPRGRPLRLGKYDDIVRECIQDLMQSGEKVSKFLAIATAKQVLTQYEPELLVENGGNLKLTGAWAKSFLRRIGVQHDC
ncbi:hypothetical protein PR048_005599 [Dryococelus australis]|uniref:Uncharacterized protein n=1 Tax=Dryococelus australis TaxID=614101 RepID=A0ABQ9IAR5_9NEOP|nr:hypothetical protein PR048_005599 [Dryococelus australis]